jgi:hypothetical protein
MMSVHWGQSRHYGCERRDLILTRSAYDHERVRQRSGVGVVKSLPGFACGPVVLVRAQKFRFLKKGKTHFLKTAEVTVDQAEMSACAETRQLLRIDVHLG